MVAVGAVPSSPTMPAIGSSAGMRSLTSGWPSSEISITNSTGTEPANIVPTGVTTTPARAGSVCSTRSALICPDTSGMGGSALVPM